MKYHFNNFLKNNKKIIQTFHSNKKIFLVDRGRFNNAIYSIYLAQILNNKFNIDCIVISDKNENSDIIKFYKSFGFQKFIKIFNYKDIFFLYFFLSILTFINAILLFTISYFKGFEWTINNLKFKGIFIGDLIYDTYIRTGHKFLNPKYDLKLFNLFFKTVFRTSRLDKIIDKKKVKCIVVGTYTYAFNDAISIRIGIKKKIKVLEPGGFVLFNYTSDVIKRGNDFCLIDNNFSKIKNIAREKKIDQFLIDRARGKKNLKHTRNIDIKIQNFSENYTKKKLLKKFGLDEKKIDKVVVFASHKFSESPHAKGKLIFRDYFDHFKQTLNYAAKTNCKNILWIFKAHPSSKDFNETDIVAKEIKRKNLSTIRLCPKNLSSYQLSKFCDLAITSRGTIGLEFASRGKPVIITGNAAYSKRGFTIEPKNKKEYFNKLDSLKTIKSPNTKNILLAKKILYYLENFKLDMMKSDIALTLEEEIKAKKNYFKYLNLKLTKKNFFQDTYYQQLKKKIKLIFK